MAILMDAGVLDSGQALFEAARWGRESAVKVLLQQLQLAGSPMDLAGNVNFCDSAGFTALFSSIASWVDAAGKPRLLSPRMVQMLVDAGADTTSLFKSRTERR
eukprot:g15305.t1